MALDFVDELPTRKGGGGTPDWVTELEANPGKWAAVPRKSASQPPAGVKLARRVVDGKVLIYGCWVGLEAAPAKPPAKPAAKK